MTPRTAFSPQPITAAIPRLIDSGRIGAVDVDAMEATLAKAREFGDRYVRPRALELDRRCAIDERDFPWDIAKAGCQYGLFSMIVPPGAGGPPASLGIQSALMMEELSAACPGVSNIFGAHSLGLAPLLFAGPVFWDGILHDVVQRERSGDPLIMAFAITEPSAGTDAEDPYLMKTAKLGSSARKVPGGYRVSGTKHFISNGSVAEWLTVYAPLDPAHADETLCCFLVDAKSDGFSVGHVEHKLGQRACPAAEVVFDDVFVPDELVVGRAGDGMSSTMLVLTASRPIVGAIATGIARGAYERLLEWIRTDPAGEAALGSQQVQLALAMMEEEIYLARQAYVDAVTVLDVGAFGPVMGGTAMRALGMLPRSFRSRRRIRELLSSEQAQETAVGVMHSKIGDSRLTQSLALSSMAKARGADVAVRVTSSALEVVGLASGPIRAELEKLWRDAKLTQIYEGTNQLNRLEVFRARCNGETLPLLPKRGGNSVAAIAGVNGG